MYEEDLHFTHNKLVTIQQQKKKKNTILGITLLYLFALSLLGLICIRYKKKPLTNTYAYEKVIQQATKAPHIARISIFPDIAYGASNDSSMRKIIHTIQLLSNNNANKGLVITLIPCKEDEEAFNAEKGFGNYSLLKDALKAYKDKTNRKIIVDVRETVAIPFLFILAIADEVILDIEATQKTRSAHTVKPISQDKDQTINFKIEVPQILKNIISANVQQNISEQKKILASGEYKLVNDPKETLNIRKRFQATIDDAINLFEQTKNNTSTHLSFRQKILLNPENKQKQWKNLCAYLRNHNGLDNPEEIKALIKKLIAEVPIIDLNIQISEITSAYLSEKRNTYRRTAPCFETITIQGWINYPLLQKIKPIIKSVQYDTNIKGVIIIYDSRGGDHKDVQELLSLLKALQHTKPIISYITRYGQSGGYEAAAATSKKIIADPNAIIGGIGTEVELYAHNKYIDQAPIRQKMIKRIAQNRARILRISQQSCEEQLYATEARQYIAYRARQEQLIDQIGTLQQAIDALKQLTQQDLPVYYSDIE